MTGVWGYRKPRLRTPSMSPANHHGLPVGCCTYGFLKLPRLHFVAGKILDVVMPDMKLAFADVAAVLAVGIVLIGFHFA